MESAANVAEVIRSARISAGLTQAELGMVCGYSRTTISRMERGQLQSVRDIDVLRRLSQALSIPPQLLGLATPGRAANADSHHTPPRVVPIREGGGWVDRRTVLVAGLAALGAVPVVTATAGAVNDPSAELAGALADRLLPYRPPAVDAPPPAVVSRALARVRAGFAGSDFRDLTVSLPQALDAAEACAANAEGTDGEPQALALLGKTYGQAAAVAIKFGRLDLGWSAANRAILAAGRSGDALAEAEAAWQVAILCRKAGRPEQTIATTITAADRLREAGLSSDDRLAMHGLLLLTAGYASAVQGDRQQWEDLADAAEATAKQLGADRWHNGFGAANVGIYRVSAEWVLGNAGPAIDAARTVPGALPTAERAERFWVDVARAFQRAGRPVECYRSLLAAERAAPQAVRVRPVVHSVTTWLLSARSTVGMAGIREFATRVATG